MRYLLLVLLFFSLHTLAQKSGTPPNEVIRIDSLPKRGVLLNKGWKFYVGDNPNYAKSDFDDSKWESINPVKDIMDLPQLPKNGTVFWLRLHLAADSLLNQQLIMTIQQSGASEIYLNGNLIHRFGVLTTNRNEIKAYSPRGEPFLLQIPPNTTQVLAVRYALQPNIFYGTHFANPNFCLLIEINSIKNWHEKDKTNQDSNNLNVIMTSIFAVLCILFFAFYLSYPTQKINLYFTIYTALQVIPPLLTGFFFNQISIENRYWAFNLGVVLMVTSNLFFLLAAYRLFVHKIGIFFWFVVLFGVVSIPMALFIYNWGWVVYGIGFNLVISFEMLRIAILGILKKKKGAWIIAGGGFVFFTSWFLFISGQLINIDLSDGGYFYALAAVAFPISVVIYLGYDLAQTNLSLQQKLLEIETLSEEKQRILATQNELLEKQVTERTNELQTSFETLKSTQDQLIQKEKLASLGELTAGIAHEIQNPLNFVNNFSELSVELIEESPLPPDGGTDENWIPDTPFGGWGAFLGDLKSNLQKINHHGKRASSIVSGMLEHSRASTGERALTDINKLADEYLRLSYHGLRAKDSTFNADYELIADENLPLINVVPQDIGRVLLNLINNAFWAVNCGTNFQFVANPKVLVKTEHTTGRYAATGEPHNQLIIKVIDNGTGMSEATKAKIFQPFFTTKPTGQGTGLGLSLAYDIVTKGHGGTIECESVEGEGTTFIVKLPIL